MKHIKMFIQEAAGDRFNCNGYHPFTVHGEKFAVTRTLHCVRKFKVTHIETGAGVPFTEAWTTKRAKAIGVNKLKKTKRRKLLRAIREAKKIIKGMDSEK